jgi:hypothetical protein
LELHRFPQALVLSELPHFGTLPSVALLPWPCLRCFRHPEASINSGWIIQASGGSGLPRGVLPTTGLGH